MPYKIFDREPLPLPFQEQLDQRFKEGWEYARSHRAPFHARKSPLDFARRRRHLRKMVTDDITMPVVFKFVNSVVGGCMVISVPSLMIYGASLLLAITIH